MGRFLVKHFVFEAILSSEICCIGDKILSEAFCIGDKFCCTTLILLHTWSETLLRSREDGRPRLCMERHGKYDVNVHHNIVHVRTHLRKCPVQKMDLYIGDVF